MTRVVTILLFLAVSAGARAQAGDPTYVARLLTPEAALKAAQVALAHCRANGFQAAIAVVDRVGVTQGTLRDRFAGPHTPSMAEDKAWTAVSFRTNTTQLVDATQPGIPQAGIRNRPRVAIVGGGQMIEAGGAPGGKEDDACAAAGITAIRDDLDLR